jgi:hypothetical protein
MIRFNPWYSYPWGDGKYSQNERAFLEDKYMDDFRMYGLMEKMLEALSNRLLRIERNGTVYEIPICNIKELYCGTDDCTVYLVDDGYYYETDMGTHRLTVCDVECIEVKRPSFEIV